MKRVNVPALVAFGIAAVLAAITALVVLEAYLLMVGLQPITWYTECATARYPIWTTFAAVVVASSLSALFAHFWWPGTRR